MSLNAHTGVNRNNMWSGEKIFRWKRLNYAKPNAANKRDALP